MASKKGISFFDILKVIIALIPIGVKLYKEIRKKENEKEKTEFLQALRDGDVDTMHALIGDLSVPGETGAGGGSKDSSETPER